MRCKECGGEISAARLRRAALFCSDECKATWHARASGRAARAGLSAAAVNAIAEQVVAADLLLRGYEVYRAASPSSSYTMLAYNNDGRIERVQVRAGYRTADGTIAAVERNHDVDLLAVVVGDREIHYEGRANDHSQLRSTMVVCPRCDGSGKLPFSLDKLVPFHRGLLTKLADGQWHEPTDLGEVTSTLSMALRRLAERGLVERREAITSYGRCYLSRITATGLLLLDCR